MTIIVGMIVPQKIESDKMLILLIKQLIKMANYKDMLVSLLAARLKLLIIHFKIRIGIQ